MAIQKAPDADARIKSAEEFLIKFADSEFKPGILRLLAASYEQKNDVDKTIIYAERALETDPQDYASMLMIANGLAGRTREFDLDKEEKLTRAEKYAQQVQDSLKTAVKPNPDLPDDQWEAIKKDMIAQVHVIRGQAAVLRKKFDVGIAEFKLAIEIGSTQDPIVLARLGEAYTAAEKYDDAIATFEKVMAMPNLHPQIRQYVQAKRAAIWEKRSGAKPAATPAAAPAAAPAPAAPPAEPKKP
jgi:tetratricopeptide (TPR) repeat protein